MPIHRINLRGPWEFEWLEPSGKAGDLAGRVKLPADWRDTFGEQGGRVRLLRRFHEPTGIEPDDRVWLHFTGVGGTASAQLDGQPLDAEGRLGRYDITGDLRPTNELVVEITCDPNTTDEPLGLYDFVTIEIESPDD